MSAVYSETTPSEKPSALEPYQAQCYDASPSQPFEPFPVAPNATEVDNSNSELFGEEAVCFDQLLAQPSDPVPPPLTENVQLDNEESFSFFDQTSAEDPSASFFDSLGESGADPFNSHMSTLANQNYMSEHSGQTLYAADSRGHAHHGIGSEQTLPAATTNQNFPEEDFRDALASRASGYVSYEEQRNLFSFSALPSQRSVVEDKDPGQAATNADQGYDTSVYQEQYNAEYPNQYQPAYDETQHADYQPSYSEGQHVDYQEGYQGDYQNGYQGDYQTEYQGNYQTQYEGEYHNDYQTSYQEGYQLVYQGDYSTEYPNQYQDYQAAYTEGYQDPYQADYTDQYQTANQEYEFSQNVDSYYQSNPSAEDQQGYYQPDHYAQQEDTGHSQYYAVPQSATDSAHEMPSEVNFNNAYSEGVPQLNEVQDITGPEHQAEHHEVYAKVASYEGTDHDFSLTQHDYTQETPSLVSDMGLATQPEGLGIRPQQLTKVNSEQTLENVTLSDDNHWGNTGRAVSESNASPFQTSGLDDLVLPAEAASKVPLPNSPDNLSDIRHGRPACGLFHFGFGGQVISMVPKVVTRFGAEGTGSSKVYPSNITLATVAFDIPVDSHSGPLCFDSKDADHQATEILQRWANQSSDAGAPLLSNLLQLLLRRDGKWEGASDAICDLLRPDLVPLQDFISPDFTPPSTSLVPQIHQLLLQGQRQEAARLAGAQGAWGHALVIASCAGKELWQETVREFTRQEAANCEGLALAYGLFAGLGKYAVNEVAGRGTWKEKLAFIFANRTPGDGVALCALGDELLATDTAAAHACYLLANGAAIHGPLDAVGLRLVLVGAPLSSNLTKANDALRLTECYELALSKSGSAGLNFLQAYKVHRAWALAGAGRLEDALNYCEAISAIITPHPPSTPHYHNTLRTQLGELVERIKNANGFKPSDSVWMKKRPTFGSLMNAMEGRINQLVMGDDATTTTSPTMELQPGPTVFRNNSPQHSSGMMFKEEAIHRSISTERFGIPQRSLLDSHPAGRRSASPHLMSSPFSHARHLTSPFAHNARQPSPNNVPDGLFSPLAAPSIPHVTEQPQPKAPLRVPTPADADDDFGFGNAASKPAQAQAQAAEPVKQEESSDSTKSGGLLGGIWNTLFGAKSGDQKTVYKAKLGEENSFYYDEAQKRWINKVSCTPSPADFHLAAGDSAPPPAAAPPPPRAAPTYAANPSSPLANGPPSAANTPPPGPGGVGRAKKGARGRYVDIFNAPN
ncbi:vesicle coat component [Entomophthora muscae]|uniref:Vesicle coat component n=1 Tax=Entomophthora muscae TaxID=34485 RepID=A0ACC2SDK1_9FUNG|nr:vesicle coat component [Entomophthora muscae]